MTEADKSLLNKDLDDTVDRLTEKVENEREAEDVPGKPSEREQAPTQGSETEPPD
jgi:hypothetical protein